MEEMRLGVIEGKFADLIWQNAPLSTRELVNICAKELGWARTTTYTVLKKLCNRAMVQMENGMVTVLVTKDEFNAIQSEKFVNNYFDGSLPAFIAAFSTRKALSTEELAEIKAMIESCEA